MMNKQNVTYDQMPSVAKALLAQLGDRQIITFSGPLGAGKTTLAQALLKQMGVTEPVISPTYTYVNVYRLPNGKTVYHFDLYRLSSADEFVAAGFDEYLYQPNSYCFIEWPEVIESILLKGRLALKLEHGADDVRLISAILK